MPRTTASGRSRIVLDIWGSATMRTGGDDLAQAFALLGVRPRWDDGSSRVAGFDILPLAVLSRPRVDVTLRISGLFRDVFPAQIALFADVVRQVAALEEAPEDNPLAASVQVGGSDAGHRIFGAAPGAYGIGLSDILADGDWSDRDALGEAYLQATSHAYGADGDGGPAAAGLSRHRRPRPTPTSTCRIFPGRTSSTPTRSPNTAVASPPRQPRSAIIRCSITSTRPRRSIPGSARCARRAGACAAGEGGQPALARRTMRHGFRGAAEIAETVDNFFAYAALTDVATDANSTCCSMRRSATRRSGSF